MCRTQVRFSQSELSFACPASASGSELFDPTQASISRRLAGLFCFGYNRPYAVCPWPCAGGFGAWPLAWRPCVSFELKLQLRSALVPIR